MLYNDYNLIIARKDELSKIDVLVSNGQHSNTNEKSNACMNSKYHA